MIRKKAPDASVVDSFRIFEPATCPGTFPRIERLPARSRAGRPRSAAMLPLAELRSVAQQAAHCATLTWITRACASARGDSVTLDARTCAIGFLEFDAVCTRAVIRRTRRLFTGSRRGIAASRPAAKCQPDPGGCRGASASRRFDLDHVDSGARAIMRSPHTVPYGSSADTAGRCSPKRGVGA